MIINSLKLQFISIELKMKFFYFVFFLFTFSTANAQEILALGTSNTNCKGVDRAFSYTVKLEQYLKEKGINIKVINAGVDGDEPKFMINRLPGLLTPNTKLVIFEPGPNDRNKFTNVKSSEEILEILRNKSIPTVYVSHTWIQTDEEAQSTAQKFGAHFYGQWVKNIPRDRVHRQFDMGSSPGHMTSEGCILWAKQMADFVAPMLKN
jgi:hypothetical protein